MGYGDFPLTGQKQFLDILDAGRRIGVCVNSGMTLVPTKSVTCIIGLGHNLKYLMLKAATYVILEKNVPLERMEKTVANKNIFDKDFILLDGAMGTMLQQKEWSLELYLKH